MQWARRVYELLGAGDAIDHVKSSTGHGYQEDKRQHLYASVERWLAPPRPQGEAELPAQIATWEELACGLPPGNRTYRDIFAEWTGPLPRSSARPGPEEIASLRAFLRERLGMPEALPPVAAERVEREEMGAWRAELWAIETEPGVRIPAALLSGEGSGDAVTLVPGRDPDAVADALAAGRRALALDPRGTGAVSDGGGATRNWAWFAGRPMSGMWALDILQAARFCREQVGASAVAVDGRGQFGWASLLAAAAEPGLINSGLVEIPWTSQRDQLAAEGDHALADVPGLLERVDVPQLRALWPAGTIRVMPREG